MRAFERLTSLFMRRPRSPEEIAAAHERQRVADEVHASRAAARSGLGSESYRGQRGSK
jgi:hypothetical protein